LPRHHQGSALYLAGRRSPAAGGPDRVLRGADGAGAPARADPDVHRRRGLVTYPGSGKPESVHLTLFPEERGEWVDGRLAAEWQRLLEVRGEVLRALEMARQQGRIGKALDAVVFVTSAPEEEWLPLLRVKSSELLKTVFNVSGVRIKDHPPRGAGVGYE